MFKGMTNGMMTKRSNLGKVAVLFLRLGFTAFGGPAAHIAIMEDEVVRRRRWISEEKFLDLLGAVNLIPGPELHGNGHLPRLSPGAGWLGLILAGVCFILPAMVIVMGIAWAYAPIRPPAAGRRVCSMASSRW